MKLRKIVFGTDSFRKLKNITIEIAPRITVIAGHNGIGKSTILGLIANCSGVRQGEKSLLGSSFHTDFQKAFFLDYYKDYQDYFEANGKKKKNIPRVILEYTNEDGKIIGKSCSVGVQKYEVSIENFKSHMVRVPLEKRSKDQHQKNTPSEYDLFSNETLAREHDAKKSILVWRLRIIPRTIDLSKTNREKEQENEFSLTNSSEETKLEESSRKVSIPTLYLGMSRMAPIGEFDGELIDKKKSQKYDIADIDFIEKSFNSVLDFKKGEGNHLISHSFLKSKKRSLVPNLEHDSFAMSLGQDSLSSIITALASFNRLKRINGEKYSGGILVIDELDAGFHPRAQERLVALLQRVGRALNLQIIVTTHSLTVIKKIISDSENHRTPVDNVVYLMDTTYPRVMSNQTYQKIKNDMLVVYDKSKPTKKIKLYFEDEEAVFFFKKILEFKQIDNQKDAFGSELHIISAGLGSNELQALYDVDDYFKKVVILPDNDVLTKQSCRNDFIDKPTICPLPGSDSFTPSTPGNERTPEGILYNFIAKKLGETSEENEKFWHSLPADITTTYVQDKVMQLNEKEKLREKMKSWFYDHKDFLTRTEMVQKWCQENQNSIDEFLRNLTIAISNAANDMSKPK